MKKILIIVAAIILLAIAGYGYTKYGKSSTTSPEKKATVQEEAKTTEEVVKGTIKSLLGAGKNVTCAISYPQEQGGGKGTIYVSGTKMSGDFTTNVDNKTVESHMVSDGVYSYVWTAGQTEGIKMKLDAASKITPPAGQKNQAAELDKEANLNCVPWTTDASKFTPPTNIKFTDLTQMLQQVQPQTGKTTEKTTTGQTSPCAQITDATAKAACEKAVSGNQ